MASHLKCGSFELPFADGEPFGQVEIGDFLQYLEEERVLRHTGDKWFWSNAAYPAEEISLRSATSENFVIINTSDNNKVLGETDLHSAAVLIHEQAIYLHQSKQFVIDKLDWDGRTAYAREVEVDYYTDAIEESDIKVISTDIQEDIQDGTASRMRDLRSTSFRRGGGQHKSFPNIKRYVSRRTKTSVSEPSTFPNWTNKPNRTGWRFPKSWRLRSANTPSKWEAACGRWRPR